MQVTFESLYASEMLKLRNQHVHDEQENKAMLDKIIDIGTALTSNQQVASLYRAIFRLLLANSTVEKSKMDRNVEVCDPCVGVVWVQFRLLSGKLRQR